MKGFQFPEVLAELGLFFLFDMMNESGMNTEEPITLQTKDATLKRYSSFMIRILGRDCVVVGNKMLMGPFDGKWMVGLCIFGA